MMPEFAHPWGFALFALLPIFAWRWRRRASATFTLPTLQGLAALPAGRSRLAQRGGLGLRLLGLGCVILAITGPRWPDRGSRVETEGISLALVVDVSSSMAQRDFVWESELLSRLEGVQKVFRVFVAGGKGPSDTEFAGRPQDLMMLVTFATRPETACPLTLDHSALLKILDQTDVRPVITEATTNPGDAIAWALHSLRKAPTRRKVLVLLTDGESNVPPPALTPRQAGQLAGNLQIPMYAIDAAPDEDTQGDAAKAKATMQAVASMTKGQYFHATDGPSLARAMQSLDQLERDRVTTFGYERYYEGYLWFALAGLVCWVVILLMEATWWRRAP